MFVHSIDIGKIMAEEDQFNRLRVRANVKKERERELEYKNLFLNLIKTNKSILTSPHEKPKDYEAETKIIKKLMEVEREAIIGSIGVGIAAFLTVRYLPRGAVRMIGGKAKVKAMDEAEAKQSLLKTAGSFLFEGTVGFWSAYRGYQLAVSLRSDDVYNDMVSLPMCEGKSIASDTICEEWHKLIKYKVSPDFWKNMNGTEAEGAKQLNNEEFFKGVFEFDAACRKRKAFEDVVRLREGKEPTETVSIPSPGVPNNILELTNEEVAVMVR